jgi:uncharacterized lipoprotein
MILRSISTLALALLLAGCGMFGTRTEYQRAQQVRPLEVPPELHAPSTQGTMVVPEVGAGRTAASGVPGGRPALAGDVLIIADEPANAWRRVSLALDRAGEITVIGSDEAQRTVEVEVVSVVEPQGGWFTRTFRRSRVDRDVFTLQILADGSDRSRVQITDSAGRPASGEAARRISSVLRQRLG